VIRIARRIVSLTFLVALLVAAVPSESHAGAKTLARSVQNLLFFPFDLALSPFVSTKAAGSEPPARDPAPDRRRPVGDSGGHRAATSEHHHQDVRGCEPE
jgi:hypothetical protein